jgi:hypothetical protein
MPKILKAILFFCATFLFAHQAKAETYFLKIEQMDTKGQKPFLQTCSPKTLYPVRTSWTNSGVLLR